MTGKRTWILFGLVGSVAGLVWAVKSGRLGGGGTSPVPIMMTPAVTLSGAVASGSASPKGNPVPATASASAVGSVAPLRPLTEVKISPPPAGLTPTRPSSAPNFADPSPRSFSETPQVSQRSVVSDGLPVEQILELVRMGRLAEARDALKALPSNESSARLVRVVMDLERELMEVGSFHRAGDWYQLEQSLERWDRPGRVVPRPEPPVVAEARAWSESQRRSRVSQKEWRLAIEEALRWENRPRIQSLLDVREYLNDPIRARARDRLATLDSTEKRLAEIRDNLRDGRLEAAERLLSTAQSNGRLEIQKLRDELAQRKAGQEALTRQWISEVNANGLRMNRRDFENSLRRIPTAQQADWAVKQAITKARQQVEAREAAATSVASRAAVTASEGQPVVAPPAIPTVIPPAARASEPIRAATNTAPSMDSDDARFMSYKQQLSSKSRGTISPDNRAKVAAFLEKYSKSHPEKAKEIRSLLENLKNSL
jgi:hypothetical protein